MLSLLQKIKTLQKVAIIFFIASGILHLGSSILLAGNILVNPANLLHKTMDIPFVLSGLLYALTSLRLRFSNNTAPTDHKTLDIVGVSVIILTLIVLLAINILFPDK